MPVAPRSSTEEFPHWPLPANGRGEPYYHFEHWPASGRMPRLQSPAARHRGRHGLTILRMYLDHMTGFRESFISAATLRPLRDVVRLKYVHTDFLFDSVSGLVVVIQHVRFVTES
jgi:hypothetical protein